MTQLAREVAQWIMSAKDMTLLLVFLVLSSATIIMITFFLLRKYLPRKWKAAHDENDAPMLTRDWFKKIEQRGDKTHEHSDKIQTLELKARKWDDAAIAVDAHAKDIGSIRTRLEQVMQRLHNHAEVLGTVRSLDERMTDVEQRLKEFGVENARQVERLADVRVELARNTEKTEAIQVQMGDVKTELRSIKNSLERLEDKLLGPKTPEPRRV